MTASIPLNKVTSSYDIDSTRQTKEGTVVAIRRVSMATFVHNAEDLVSSTPFKAPMFCEIVV